jgi:hypothetical protein
LIVEKPISIVDKGTWNFASTFGYLSMFLDLNLNKS